MSGKNFMSYGDADTILTEFSNDIKSRVSTKANQGLTAQQQANAKANIDIDKVPNVATNDQTPTFLEESTRTNIASGDKLSLIFGKIKKFFSDLKAVAFSGSYNDLSDIPTLVECSTARNVAAKTVTLPGFKLKTGSKIIVRFTDTGSSNPASGNITLNVNGTGAKEIIDGHANMTKATYTYNWFYNNQTIEFIYDGTYWVNLNRDNNTTYSSKAAASGGTATSLCTTGEKYTWNNKANTSDIPTTLSSLSDDSTHRTVTDTEKTTWSGKANKKTTMDSYYGTSSTAADTAAKVITVTDSDGNFSLRPGIAIMVKFSAVNTAENPTFNVNNTGAKPVFYNTAVVTTGTLWAGGNTRPARYVYDGTNWVWMGQALDSNTTYSAMSKAELTTGTATSLRTVRADYLKAGINSLIDAKIAGKADKTDINDVYSVIGRNGAKNLIPYPYYRPNHYETNGITYDVSSDGVITMQTGTSTAADANYHMRVRGDANTSLHLDKGTYILSGCDINAPNSVSIIINGKDKNGNNKNVVSQTSQYPDGIKFTIDDTYDLDMFGVLVYCGSGVTISSALTFKPMIRLASDTDDTYQPYAMTNKQLTEKKANSSTSLAGYGITDAYTKTQVDAALGNKVDKSVLGLLQYHTISNIDSPWDSGVEALTVTFYRVSTVSQHSGTMPFGNASFVLCTSHSSKNYGMQIAFSDNPECFAARSLSSGTWGAWKKIGDSGTKLGSSVSLNNYSSSTNKYTIPSDGYVMVYAGSGTGFSVSFDSVNSGTEVIKISSNAPYTRQSIFVKKGMKVYGYAIGGSSYQFLYYPLQ